MSEKIEIQKIYNPSEAEDEIYKKWEESGYFNPDNLDLPLDALTYTIILPPPNITDKLHLGHSAMLAIEDLLIRYHRMKGYRALWIPGTDHAAISTQNVVEKKLLKEEGLTRHDLGREKFLERVWEFLRETQATILRQTRKMGASLDWSRTAFTLDEPRVEAVQKMFIDMYNAGVIYRGERIVNWCPRCHSTLADDEVEYKAQKAKLYTFKYSKDFPFSISTTRPETKLGDTAVAVNPKDKRYEKYIGKTYDVDFCGIKLKLKIIADRHVEMDFGTGALGVTPAHSMADWQMAQENGLKIIKVIGEDGTIEKLFFSEYSGKTVEEARKMIVEKLKENDLLEKEEEIENNLSVCYRCGTPVEPLPSKQWFVAVDKKIEKLGNKSLKEKAIEVVKNKEIKFIPDRFEKIYLNWMENLHDWCISRQIWFGHRIPVWYKHVEKQVEITYYVHGTTIDNEQHLSSGHYDVELSELGLKQNQELKEIVKNRNYDIVFCSDLKRAVQTANTVFGGRIEIIKDKRLRECDYGDFTRDEEGNLDKYNRIYTAFPNGESYKDAEKRIQNFLEEIMKKYQGKKIAIIAHQAPQLALEVLLNSKSWKQAFDEDWRNMKAYQPGWDYELKELKYVGENAPEGDDWVQDPDSLDTWFSSGMWTFSTLGWLKNFKDGKKTGDLAKFHPTQVLETGYEILTLWVSRMIMMSLFAIGEVPFYNVYLHGMILDKHGKKMSKSKGNGIDPIDMIDKFGTDAVRLSLLMGSTPGNDARLSEEKIEGFRNFTNKLWNIARYVESRKSIKSKVHKVETKNLTLADRWILERLDLVIESVTHDIENYRFSQAGEILKDFTWNDFADWYLEVSKIEGNKDGILIFILKNLLKLWHPFMPFVTEKIWQEMGNEKMLMIEKWPGQENQKTPLGAMSFNNVVPEVDTYNQYSSSKNFVKSFSKKQENNKVEGDFNLIKNIIISIRTIRSENNIEPSKKIKAVICAGANKELVESQAHLIKNLKTGIGELEIKEKGEKIKNAIYTTVGGIDIYLIGAVDFEKEKERIKGEIEEVEKYIKQIEGKLNNQEFVNNAPEAVVQQDKEKLAAQRERMGKLEGSLGSLTN